MTSKPEEKSFDKLENLANNREAVKSNELELGASVEGYLLRVTEKPNRNPKFKQPNVSIFLVDAEGNETVVFASGNLSRFNKLIKEAKIEPGTKIRLTKVEPPKDTQYKNYFDMRVNREDILDLNSITGTDGSEEY